MLEGCDSCNFWYHERILYKKIILIFPPQSQMNTAWEKEKTYGEK